MEYIRDLYSAVTEGFKRTNPVSFEHRIDVPSSEADLHFSMGCNGFASYDGQSWVFSSHAIKPMVEAFKAQRVSFFGPMPDDIFFSDKNMGAGRLVGALSQPPVR